MRCYQQRKTADAHGARSTHSARNARGLRSAYGGVIVYNTTKAHSERKIHRLAKAHRPTSILKPRTKALPLRLKRGMEKLTGVNLSNVRVHYNSPKPALLQAHAYAQGRDIYLAPNQEHHLPHELGHVAQQALGMVKPTKEVNGVVVNDDPKLEKQASEWGNQALNLDEKWR